MRAFFNLLVKYNYWFLFLLLQAVCFALIVRFNNYQGASFFTAAGGVAGSLNSMFMNINTYFNLHDENEGLLIQNLMLTRQLESLKNELQEHKGQNLISQDGIIQSSPVGYDFYTATVVNNSVNRLNNYITLNKGSEDGITPEMGVFSGDGVIGMVYLVSNNYSLVMPLLNSKSSLSCRVKNNDSFCSLHWEGGDARYSYLVDLPRYTLFEVGDTVITSGFSSIFPQGLPVGTIDQVDSSSDGLFYRIRVKLFVDFSKITSVFIVGNKEAVQQRELESEIPKR